MSFLFCSVTHPLVKHQVQVVGGGNGALEGKLHVPVFSPLVVRDLQNLASLRGIYKAVGVPVGLLPGTLRSWVVGSSHSHEFKSVETPGGNVFQSGAHAC